MDALNHPFYRLGMLSKIEVAMIGRMAAGWARGRFVYGNPGEMRQAAHETRLGYLAHYAIGIGLAGLYVTGWHFLVGGPVSAGWAVVYGLATTAASYFFVYPCMGLGVFGRRSPESGKSMLSPLANHLFFGVGMGVGIALV